MKTQVIYESANTLIFIREDNEGQQFAVKVLKAPNPSQRQIAKWENEFELTKDLELKGIRKALRKEQSQGKMALVFPYLPGITLREYSRKADKKNLENSLKIALELAALLTELHDQRIIHRDFNSNNLIIDPDTLEITLIDFELSTRQSAENSEVAAELDQPESFEGTLAFISPEQTGRLNLAVDHRTDLYALGVTLFELFTGELPFQFEDQMEMIHAHLAQQPEAPHLLHPELPEMLSAIILKLLAKDLANRYQRARSLHADLHNCLTQWQETQTISQFELAHKDKIRDFVLPNTLYGREPLFLRLEKCFDGVQLGTVEVSFLGGAAGTGKTAISNYLRPRILNQNGYFIRGQFDQMRRDIPYQALIQGFTEFINILLTEDVYQLEVWKRKIIQALGQNGKVLTEVVPQLELIIGRQPDLPEVGPAEAQNRFTYVVQNFIRAISTQEHPLVLFLDNFQWADPATFNLLKTLALDKSNQYLWLIIAFRPDQALDVPDIQQLLREHDILVHEDQLENLTLEEVIQFVSDTIHTSLEASKSLAAVLFAKTQGNPFFLRQTLLHMYEEGLLRFSPRSQEWEWELNAIHRLSITDNVVDLMAEKIKKLSRKVQEVLKLAACIGLNFDLNILSSLSDQSIEKTITRLAPALTEGLVLAGESGYHFSHGRIRQAIYSLIPESKRSGIHLQIGRLMMRYTPESERQNYIFEIVNQWNRGLGQIDSREDRLLLATLNYDAGLKANNTAAYETAILYLQTGIDLIAQYGWQNHYRLNLNMHTVAAQAAYLSGNIEWMEKWVTKVLQQTVSVLDKIEVYEIQLQAQISRHRMVEAAETGLRVLEQLGIRFPTRIARTHIAWTLFKTRFSLRGKSMDSLLSLPIMTDPYQLAAMRIMNSAGAALYITRPRLAPLMASKQVEISLKYGNCPYSANAYVSYALSLYAATGDIDTAYEFGEMGLQLLDQFDAKELSAMTTFMFYSSLWSFKNHSRESLKAYLKGYESGMETGDLPGAGFCVMRYGNEAYMTGLELQQTEREMAKFANELEQNGQESALYYLSMGRQIAQNLIYPVELPFVLKGELYDEAKMVPLHQRVNDQSGIANLYLNKFILAYLFEAFEHAAEYRNQFDKQMDFVSKQLNPPYYFYYSLNELARFPEASQREQKRILKLVGDNQEKLRVWADSAPMNYLHKFYLVEAELYRVIGQEEHARSFYDKAIELAREYEYLNEEALAWKLTGKFYREQGHRFLAETYLQEAVKAYERWGAKSIVAFLNRRYPSYVDPPGSRTRSTTSSSSSTGTQDGLKGLDMASITKATQALSGEVVLSNLLEKIMQIVLENAGASRGIFIESRNNKLFLLAQSESKSGTRVTKPIPIEEALSIPHTLVNFVVRTQKQLVLEHAAQDPKYQKDPYLQQIRPAAVLCFPIEYKSQLLGVIYLENQDVPGTFTPERVEVLNILSSQMAISIENARLYEHLDEKVRGRTQQLNQKNQELAKTLNKLQSAQQKLVQSEKMASLGQLTAGIAHEINNPINFVSGNINPLIRDIGEVRELLHMINELDAAEDREKAIEAIKAYRDEIDADFLFEEIEMLLDGIRDGAKRTKEIVAGLRYFSRLDAEEFLLADLGECLDSTLTLLNNKIKNRIEIIRDYGDIPKVKCLPGKLNQVFMNILNNAIQAIPQKGSIRLETRIQGKYAEISIQDSGVGMPPDVQQRIFEPFYTTKDVGEGTGLGLSISFGIIEQHDGTIEVNSTPGEGSKFIIRIPIDRE